MLLKNSLLLSDLFCNSNLNSADFTKPNQSSEISILEIEMLLEFKIKGIVKLLGSN